jgi:protein-disulfide isomerase
MAKAVKRRKTETATRQTNWLLIGGVVVAGVILLFTLLALSLRPPQVLDLAEYCTTNDENCVAFGPADADVTVVEVYDYACPACGNFALTVEDQVQEAYFGNDNVRWIFFPYSLPQFQDVSISTAAAALCVAEQGEEQFLAFHKRMFEIQQSEEAHTRPAFEQAAADIGADVEALAQCLESGRNRDLVEENLQAATRAEVNSTPSFYVNGQAYRNIGSFQQIQQIIEPQIQ